LSLDRLNDKSSPTLVRDLSLLGGTAEVSVPTECHAEEGT
jgi:hypothetical protein